MLHVVVTRPTSQAQNLIERIKQAGWQATSFPCIEIEIRIPEQRSQQLAQADLIIFMSQNAVASDPAQLDLLRKSRATILAIGPATANQLKEAGVTQSITIPNQFNSEGLLDCFVLQQVKNKSIVICCGENPRPLLATTLSDRGAKITELYCYRRILPCYTAQDLAKLTSQTPDLIICQSKQTLENLVELLKQQPAWLQQQQLLVISQSMQDLAQKMQFNKEALIANNASDTSVFAAIELYYQHIQKRSGESHE